MRFDNNKKKTDLHRTLHIIPIIDSANHDQLITERGLSRDGGGNASLINFPEIFPFGGYPAALKTQSRKHFRKKNKNK